MRQKMKKSQAALEFLMTYGWAFLVILVMIGALAYFGVLNPKKLLPEKCTVPAGFTCDEYQITTTGVKIILTNNQGGAINANSAVLSGDYTFNGTADVAPTTLIGVGNKINISQDFDTTKPPVKGDKIGISFNLDWTAAGKTLNQTATGDVFATVQ